jgi:hypothetical protein
LAVEFQIKVPSLNINVDSKQMKLGGGTMTGNIVEGCSIAFAMGKILHGGGVAIHMG